MQITVYNPQKGRLETIDAEFTKDYGGPRNLDSVLSYTWEQKQGGPSGEFEEEAHTII